MKATIHLETGQGLVKVEILEDDGSQVEKTITVQNFREIFKEKEAKKYFCLNPMFDTYKPAESEKGLICGVQRTDSCEGLFFVPADKRYMNVAGEQNMMPYPGLLFRLSATNGKLMESRCFAVKERQLSELTLASKLYAFPFGNVYPMDAHICWGSNQLAGMYDYEKLRGAITTFFCSESNMDYVKTGESYAKKYGTYQNFLGELGKKDVFPKTALVRSPFKATLFDLIDSM